MIEVFDTGVKLNWPPAHLFKLPPDDPPTLLPPSEGCHWTSLKCPMAIDPTFYRRALEPNVPLTFAAVYFASVTLMNQINKRRRYRAWGFSRTRLFFLFTVLHNVALALYSALTFAAMARMVHESFPGWLNPHGLAGTVDALCKLHGPRGYGDAVTYNQTTDTWSAKNSLIHLADDLRYPDSTDVGRIWNEGLAFWGFWFYLSKLYEVVDTVIILSKGKRSSTLQTYHHTGAMFCMWAGIRYMAAPIYMFVLINSFIHTLMYTFYTVSTLGYKVPQRLKQLITSLQILQLLTGVGYASAHLFISYNVPVTNIFKLASALASPKAASSVVSSLVADATEIAQQAGDLPPWVKRLVYRAAGAEALAEAVHDGHVYTDRHAAEKRWDAHNATEAEEIRYEHRTHHETVDCLDTNGQAFAVWLNVAYLLPLTVLFVRFFVKSYIKKSREEAKKPRKARDSFAEARRWSESAQEAARETAETVECLGVEAEEAIDDEIDYAERKIDEVKSGDAGQAIKSMTDDVKKSADSMSQKVGKQSQDVKRALGRKAEDLKKSVDESGLEESYVKVKDEVKSKFDELSASQSRGESSEQRSSSSTSQQSTKQTSSSSFTSSSSSSSTTTTATGVKSQSSSEGEWMRAKSKIPKKAKEPKDILNPDPAGEAAESGASLSYADAVKEDLEPGDHGEQPGPVENPVDGSMGFGLNG